MFRTLVRRAAARAPRQRTSNPKLMRSAVSRSSAASTVLVESLGHHFLAGPAAATGRVATFHTSSPKLDTHNSGATVDKPPFEKLLAANRGEIGATTATVFFFKDGQTIDCACNELIFAFAGLLFSTSLI